MSSGKSAKGRGGVVGPAGSNGPDAIAIVALTQPKRPVGRCRILLIGASGHFGARLARLLAQEEGMTLLLAGRRRAPLVALAAAIDGAEALCLDRALLTAETLRANRIDLVIDASGPFQLMRPIVVEAAIAAGVDYIDLADGRDFVRGVAAFDAAARASGVAIISGASSTPALSHAVIDRLTRGWQRIDTIRVAISPSNRQPHGQAVIESILSAAGQPLRLFADGQWRMARGWGGLTQIDIPHVGRRWASLCDTPDLDLLVSRYQPKVAAQFFGSLELPVMHLGLSALTGLVRAGLMRSLMPLGRMLSWAATRLQPFGNDRGGMVVEVRGANESGGATVARWWLAATGKAGPHTPVLAALALARRHRDQKLGFTGATACTGLLTLDDFAADFARLGIETGEAVAPLATTPIFEHALGKAFDDLPATTRALHRPAPTFLWRGRGSAEGGANALAGFIARCFRLPQGATDIPVHVVIEQDETGAEAWARVWPGVIMRSIMQRPGEGDGGIEEHFGPFAFRLQLDGHRDGIDMKLVGARLFGIRLPRFLLPRISATERAVGNRHLFDVAIALPLVGRLVRYHGWLEAANDEPGTSI
jgi:saccharopine dehydrogenase-like NADP-dependent oxidoreductase